MWKVTSVTSDLSSRWRASHTEASSPGGCCCDASSGTGNRQPSRRLIFTLGAEDGRERSSSASSEGGSLTPARGGREQPLDAQFGGARKSREKPPRPDGRRSPGTCRGAPILSSPMKRTYQPKK